MVAVTIVVTITTVTDYTQAQQFRNLFKKSEVKFVKAMRCGKLTELNSHDLLVGDVFEVSTGLILPADCLLIEKHADFLVDESQMTGESHHIKKTPDNHPAEDATPFLISGSKIQDGSGFALVLAVGLHSQLGILRASMESEPEDTPLQLKLTDLAEMIGNIGMLGASLTFIGCTLRMVMTIVWDEHVAFAYPSVSF
jgi:Ca2+-transporting ATPase